MELTLEALGLDEDKLQQMVVDRLCDKLLHGWCIDEDGNAMETDSGIYRKLTAAVQTIIDESVKRLADKHVLPKMGEHIDGMILQETNRWGETKGAPLTVTEYLLSRAEAYMTEQVNYDGKPKGSDGYSWSAKGTRLEHMIHQHMQYQIEHPIKEALLAANGTLAKAIQEAVAIKLNEIVKALKVDVRVP